MVLSREASIRLKYSCAVFDAWWTFTFASVALVNKIILLNF